MDGRGGGEVGDVWINRGGVLAVFKGGGGGGEGVIIYSICHAGDKESNNRSRSDNVTKHFAHQQVNRVSPRFPQMIL